MWAIKRRCNEGRTDLQNGERHDQRRRACRERHVHGCRHRDDQPTDHPRSAPANPRPCAVRQRAGDRRGDHGPDRPDADRERQGPDLVVGVELLQLKGQEDRGDRPPESRHTEVGREHRPQQGPLLRQCCFRLREPFEVRGQGGGRDDHVLLLPCRDDRHLSRSVFLDAGDNRPEDIDPGSIARAVQVKRVLGHLRDRARPRASPARARGRGSAPAPLKRPRSPDNAR